MRLPDFSPTYLLSLKGMQEGKYSCKLREILRVDDARNFSTFKIHATSCTECFLCLLFSQRPHFSVGFYYDVPLGDMINMPSVVRPLSLMNDRMS